MPTWVIFIGGIFIGFYLGVLTIALMITGGEDVDIEILTFPKEENAKHTKS